MKERTTSQTKLDSTSQFNNLLKKLDYDYKNVKIPTAKKGTSKGSSSRTKLKDYSASTKRGKILQKYLGKSP